MELEGNSNAATSASFLGQLRERHPGSLTVIWDNAPAHRGEAVREEATGNLCLGTSTLVQARVSRFLAALNSRKEEVKRRCRTLLQSRAEALLQDSRPDSLPQANTHPPLALV